MKLAVFGLWHLGSVTAACMASKGFEVTGLDLDNSVIHNLNLSKAPLFEPGLNELIETQQLRNTLHFTTDPKQALQDADYLWVTFDTPVDDNDNADVLFVYNQVISVLKYLKPGAGIILSSQAPVGFTQSLEEYALKNLDQPLVFASSPENLRLGKAIPVFLDPDRIVIGIRSEQDKAKFIPLFGAITNRLEWMKTESAEMTKHAINAFLATSVTFINEIASICEEVGADTSEVTRGLKSEQRIGPKAYLGAGSAFAGGTLARDIVFLTQLGAKFNKPSYLLRSVRESNDHHKEWIRRQCLKQCETIAGKKFTLLGLTYKPDTNTLRRSLAIELAKWLHENGGIVLGYDPKVDHLPEELKNILALSSDVSNAIRDAHVVIIATEWPQFKDLDDSTIACMSQKVVIDPNAFLKTRFEKFKNTTYINVGRSLK